MSSHATRSADFKQSKTLSEISFIFPIGVETIKSVPFSELVIVEKFDKKMWKRIKYYCVINPKKTSNNLCGKLVNKCEIKYQKTHKRCNNNDIQFYQKITVLLITHCRLMKIIVPFLTFSTDAGTVEKMWKKRLSSIF